MNIKKYGSTVKSYSGRMKIAASAKSRALVEKIRQGGNISPEKRMYIHYILGRHVNDDLLGCYNALYLFPGDSENANKYNALDPRDLDEAFRLTFHGIVEHTEKGIKSDGETGYADTYLVPSEILVEADTHLSFCAYDNLPNFNSTNAEMGVENPNTTNQFFLLVRRFNNLSASIAYNQDSGILLASQQNAVGLTVGSRKGIEHKLWKNGTVIASKEDTGGHLPTGAVVILNYRSQGGVSQFTASALGCAFASVGRGMSDIELQRQSRIISFGQKIKTN